MESLKTKIREKALNGMAIAERFDACDDEDIEFLRKYVELDDVLALLDDVVCVDKKALEDHINKFPKWKVTKLSEAQMWCLSVLDWLQDLKKALGVVEDQVKTQP